MSPEQFIHYLVGNPKFDAGHYLIFEKINIFKAQPNSSIDQGLDATRDILTTFVMHCEDEEIYMKEMNFAFLEFHKEIHKSLQNTLQRFINSPRSHVNAAKQLLYDFSLTLAKHIDEDDRQFYDLHKI
jgi:hemerythrin